MSDDSTTVPPADANQPAASTPAPADPAAIPVEPAAPLPPENVGRGTVLALLAIPAGILVFLIIWSLGFIASIVGFGVAFAALFLYRRGSGGRISVIGAVVVAAITLVTLVLAVLVGELSDVATALSQVQGRSWIEVVQDPTFLPFAFDLMGQPDVIGAVLGDFGLSLLFGVIGCGALLFGAFREARNQAPAVEGPAAP